MSMAALAGAFIKFCSEHHVGEMNGSLALDNCSFRVLLVAFGVFLDHFHTFHNNPLFAGKDLDDFSALASFRTGNHDHFIVLFYMLSCHTLAKSNYFGRQ